MMHVTYYILQGVSPPVSTLKIKAQAANQVNKKKNLFVLYFSIPLQERQ